jgi:heme-degrading monooxygenase HmoA
MERYFRIDRFTGIPAQGREEFLERVHSTQQMLRAQDGYVRGYVLEQPGDAQTSTILTFAEWENADVVPRVTQAVAEFHRAQGYNPNELLARLGITVERGAYRGIGAQE